MNHSVQSSDRLQVAAESVINAAPETVWPLIADASRYPQWGPWSECGYRGAAGHAPGTVYWLRSANRAYGRYVKSVERIEEVEEGRRLVYTVVGGIPVRGYRAEITLTPSPEGTHISWAASFDNTLRGRLVWRGLRDFYPAMMADLTAYANAAATAAGTATAENQEASP